MERKYWIRRMHAAMGMARRATTAESRLIHYDLAGRYSIKAANVLPFLVTRKEPATVGEQAALHLPNTADRDRKPGFGGEPDGRNRDRGGRR
jgi:hypothetical protein